MVPTDKIKMQDGDKTKLVTSESEKSIACPLSPTHSAAMFRTQLRGRDVCRWREWALINRPRVWCLLPTFYAGRNPIADKKCWQAGGITSKKSWLGRQELRERLRMYSWNFQTRGGGCSILLKVIF